MKIWRLKQGRLKLWRFKVTNKLLTQAHNFIEGFRSHRCSVMIDGEYIFSPEEARLSRFVEKYD